MNNKFERIWKEVANVLISGTPKNLSGRTEGNHKILSQDACLQAKIWNQDHSNMRQEC
jgi:hypothetical protein